MQNITYRINSHVKNSGNVGKSEKSTKNKTSIFFSSVKEMHGDHQGFDIIYNFMRNIDPTKKFDHT